jgi:hypothetical protein
LHQLKPYLREFKIYLFYIKTKHGITVLPLREYIEEWLKKALIKINEPEYQEIVRVVIPPQPQNVPIK